VSEPPNKQPDATGKPGQILGYDAYGGAAWVDRDARVTAHLDRDPIATAMIAKKISSAKTLKRAVAIVADEAHRASAAAFDDVVDRIDLASLIGGSSRSGPGGPVTLEGGDPTSTGVRIWHVCGQCREYILDAPDCDFWRVDESDPSAGGHCGPCRYVHDLATGIRRWREDTEANAYLTEHGIPTPDELFPDLPPSLNADCERPGECGEICHCGDSADHGFMDGHSAVPMLCGACEAGVEAMMARIRDRFDEQSIK
jgi:hypothetical protein